MDASSATSASVAAATLASTVSPSPNSSERGSHSVPKAHPQPQRPSLGLSELPTDILLHLFSFLPYRPRLLILPLVCKKFRTLSPQSITSLRPFPWDFVYSRKPSQIFTTWPRINSLAISSFAHLELIGPYVGRLRSFEFDAPGADLRCPHRGDCSSLSSIAGLTRLSLGSTMCRNAHTLLANNMPTLRSLELIYPSNDEFFEWFRPLKRYLDNLSSLTVRHRAFPDGLSLLAPYITHLKLVITQRFRFPRPPVAFPRLTHLTLVAGDFHPLNHIQLSEFISNCQTLSHVSLLVTLSEPLSTLPPHLISCTRARELDFPFLLQCTNVTALYDFTIMRSGLSNFSGRGSLFESSLFASSFPQLQLLSCALDVHPMLSYSNCFPFSVWRLPRLRTLRIRLGERNNKWLPVLEVVLARFPTLVKVRLDSVGCHEQPSEDMALCTQLQKLLRRCEGTTKLQKLVLSFAGKGGVKPQIAEQLERLAKWFIWIQMRIV